MTGRRFLSAAIVGAALFRVAMEAFADGAEPKQVTLTLGDARAFLGTPPAGWQTPAFDDRGWAGPARGPFAPRPATGSAPTTNADGVTLLDVVPGGTLLIRRSFDVAGEPARVRGLELRVRYADGFVAYLNGREVARRNLAAGPLDRVRPPFPNSREIERVTVAVPSGTGGILKARGNLLALAVVGAAVGSPLVPVAPAGDVTLAAFSGVRIVRGPYLMAPAEHTDRGASKGSASVSVAWETDLPATGVITIAPAFDPAPDRSGGRSKPRQVRSRRATLRQVVKLAGLARGDSYRYSLAVTAARGDSDERGPFVLKTMTAPPQPARFAVYGDMRAPGHAAHAEVVAGLVREVPALVLNTGDLTEFGSEESAWQRYFDITAPLGAIAPVVPALGNHDVGRGGLGAVKTWNLFGLPAASPHNGPPGWTSFDLSDVHFIILDSNQMTSRAQQTWLESDLAEVRRRRHRPRAIFAFCHDGPWSSGPHGGSAIMSREFAPRLAAGGVDVIFSGHDHIYERGVGATDRGPLPYVIAGGGGAPLYNPTCQGPGSVAATGVPGPLPPCPPTVTTLIKAYNYVMVEVGAKAITLCAKRPDGSPLEPCVGYPLRR